MLPLKAPFLGRYNAYLSRSVDTFEHEVEHLTHGLKALWVFDDSFIAALGIAVIEIAERRRCRINTALHLRFKPALYVNALIIVLKLRLATQEI
ncbi:MAG: hypothetical protein AAB794_02770 [Patescibacteria group bacterium]